MRAGDDSDRHSHFHFRDANLRALEPLAVGSLTETQKLSVITSTAENLAIIVETHPPHGRPMVLKNGEKRYVVGNLTGVVLSPVAVRCRVVHTLADARRMLCLTATASTIFGRPVGVRASFDEIVLGPGLAVGWIVHGTKTYDSHIAIHTRRRNDVVAPDIAGRPRHIPHQTSVTRHRRGLVELLFGRGDAVRVKDHVARAVDFDRVHCGDHQAQRVRRHACAQRCVARIGIRIKAYPERRLHAAIRLLTHRELIGLRPVAQVLGHVVFIDCEAAVGSEKREVRLARLVVVAQREGAIGGARRAVVEGGFRAVLGAVASEAAARSGGGVLCPELEATLDTKGGDEVWIDCRREPLEL